VLPSSQTSPAQPLFATSCARRTLTARPSLTNLLTSFCNPVCRYTPAQLPAAAQPPQWHIDMHIAAAPCTQPCPHAKHPFSPSTARLLIAAGCCRRVSGLYQLQWRPTARGATGCCPRRSPCQHLVGCRRPLGEHAGGAERDMPCSCLVQV
jgi:hypothetical protein